MYLKERKGDSTRHVTLTIMIDHLAALRRRGENVNGLVNSLLEEYCRELQHKSITAVAQASARSKGREKWPSIKVNLRIRSDLLAYLTVNTFSVGGVVRHLIEEYLQTAGEAQAAERSEA